jgi:hypothetical protein
MSLGLRKRLIVLEIDLLVLQRLEDALGFGILITSVMANQ